MSSLVSPPAPEPRQSGSRAAVLTLVALGLAGTLPGGAPSVAARSGDAQAARTAESAPTAEAVEATDPVAVSTARGYALLERRLNDEAIRVFREADELAGGRSPEVLIGLARAYYQLGASASAEKAARRALTLAADAPLLRAAAQNMIGLAVLANAEDDPEQLAEAESLLREAFVGAGEGTPLIGFNLAEVLMRLGRDEEAVPLLEDFLAIDPDSSHADRARALLADPRRARENIVPAFSMVTLDGRYLTPKDFAGRAVLLDFWGTWCVPCRNATPALRRLAKRNSDQPFVLIGVSNDSSRQVLERYLEEHGVGWPQVWDQSGELRKTFQIRGFPTYVLIDHEGRVVHRTSGWSPATQRFLAREIKAAVKAAGTAGEDGG